MFFAGFQVSVVGETINKSGQSNAHPVKVPECKLSNEFSTLLENGTLSDVILAVGNPDEGIPVREFNAHKAILAGKFRLHVSMTLLSSQFPHQN